MPIIANECCLWFRYHRCGSNISFRDSSKFELVIQISSVSVFWSASFHMKDECVDIVGDIRFYGSMGIEHDLIEINRP